MPDALSPTLAKAAVEACLHARAAAHRFRRALAQGRPYGEALESIRAYLIILRPGLPMVLAQEQAEAIAAAIGQASLLQRPPLDLLLDLATPLQPADAVPAP